MGTARLPDWLRRSRAARQAPADEEAAELTASYWRAYDARMPSVGLADVARPHGSLRTAEIRFAGSGQITD